MVNEFYVNIDKLYQDTKELREIVLNNSEISRQILDYQNSMDFWEYLSHMEDNDFNKYNLLREKLLKKEDIRLRMHLKKTSDDFVKEVINSKLNNPQREIDLSDEEVQIDAFHEIKSLLPYSENILGYGHKRIFYTLGKIQSGGEGVWLGYKKIISSWGDLSDPVYSDAAREIEGLCNNEFIPLYYLMIISGKEDKKLLGIITQDITNGGNKVPKQKSWQSMDFPNGKKYVFDAKHHGGGTEEFKKGARLVELAINISDLNKSF